MPESGPKKHVVTYSTASKDTTRRDVDQPSPKDSPNPRNFINVSALGSSSSIPNVPKEESIVTAEEQIEEKITVMKLSDDYNVVCITETKGHLRHINEIVKRHNAKAVIHTGDFGFYDKDSYKNISSKELRHMTQYGPIPSYLRSKLFRMNDYDLRAACSDIRLSELELFLTGKEQFDVPVYVVWGNQEDIAVVKKFNDGTYQIPNLFLLNQDASFVIPAGNQNIRLFGTGGSFLYHKFFDIGQGTPIVSGAEGSMWATLIQIGNLIELGERYNDPNEVRVLVCHVPPGKEGLVNQIAMALKVDFTITGALHGKFPHCYTDFSVRTLANYLEHTSLARMELPRLWKHIQDTIGVDKINSSDFAAIERVMSVVQKVPSSEEELKHIYHLNLTDAKTGYVLFTVTGDNISLLPMIDQGWNVRRSSINSKARNHRPIAKHPHHKEKKDHNPAEPEDIPETPKKHYPFAVTVHGFDSEMSKEDIIKAFALGHFKFEESEIVNDKLNLMFNDEAAYTRCINTIPFLKHSGKYLTCEGNVPIKETQKESSVQSPKENEVLADQQNSALPQRRTTNVW